jgi:lipopolysaccharide transport system ATP-binding protein
MSSVAVSVQGIGKRYRIAHHRERYGRLTESLSSVLRAPVDRLRRAPRHTSEWFWALDDISFEVAHGEVVGIIGRNGAGKSTLLKVLSRITEPTTGTAEMSGRVASLLEVGTGFHPELTGRENIYLSGSILGMRRAEMSRRFDEIVDFAGVERFLDTPVKRYSSGMQVRLGFAVAAHLDPDILIVDEVLAVGDAAFQRRSMAKLGDARSAGRTVLVVSHNMAIVESLCSRSLLLERGELTADGTPAGVIRRYMGEGMEDTEGDVPLLSHPGRVPGMSEYITRARSLDAGHKPNVVYPQGDPIAIELTYDATACPTALSGIGIAIYAASGARVCGFNNYMATLPPYRIPQAGAAVFTIERPTFTPGDFTVTVTLGTDPGTLVDKVEHVLRFHVEPRDIYGTGYVLTPDDGVVGMDCSIAYIAEPSIQMSLRDFTPLRDEPFTYQAAITHGD